MTVHQRALPNDTGCGMWWAKAPKRKSDFTLLPINSFSSAPIHPRHSFSPCTRAACFHSPFGPLHRVRRSLRGPRSAATLPRPTTSSPRSLSSVLTAPTPALSYVPSVTLFLDGESVAPRKSKESDLKKTGLGRTCLGRSQQKPD